MAQPMTANVPEPVAQGELAKTPFAHVLLHLLQKQRSGTLVLWPTTEGAQGQDRIRFADGWPVAARFVERANALDRGLLPLFARREGPYAFYEADLVGEAVLKGRVDPWMVLTASLRGPSRDEVIGAYLSSVGDESTVRFRPGVDRKRYQFLPKEEAFIDVVRAAPAPVGELVSLCELGPAMGRRLLYLLFVTNALERFEEAVVAPSPASIPVAAPAPIPSMPVPAVSVRPPSPSDLPLPDLPLPDAAPAPSMPPRASGSMPRPSIPSARTSSPGFEPGGSAVAARFKSGIPTPPPPPQGLSTDNQAFWEEVIARCAEIDAQNYYDMLAVPRDASAETVRRAYFGLAKRWHPDRASGELAPLRPYVEQVFSLFTQAQETLGDEKKRGNYLRIVQEGGGTPAADRQLEAILWAAKEHQKAEILIRRREFDGAGALLASAIEVYAEEADLFSSYAWCLFNGTGSEGRIAEMTTAVDRALAIEPKHDRAHYYKGMILLRQGRDAEAATHFRKAVEINPKNVDAMREVRLVEMRTKGSGATGKHGAATSGTHPSKPPPKGESGGFLSKLFGSKKS